MHAADEILEPPRVEGAPYPYFLLHLGQISEWLRAGFTKKTVWETCRAHPSGFSGSYRTFLRYCQKHGLRGPCGHVAPKAPRPESALRSQANEAEPSEPSLLGTRRPNRYPAPLAKPPVLKLTEEDWKG